MPTYSKTIRFGRHDVKPAHMAITGTTGAGKTTLVRQVMQTGLPPIGTGVDHRALIFDPKQEFVPLLAAIAPHAQLVITNPFDERSWGWAIWKDCQEVRVAIELVTILIPHVADSQPFWSDAARHLTLLAMISLMLSGIEWTLADLLRILQSERLLKATLKRHPETREGVSLYLSERRLAANIISTLGSKLLAFSPIAAAWEHAKHTFSLTEWTESESILVLTNSEVSRFALANINRCISKRASDLTLASPASKTRRNWFIFDELSEAGKLDWLVSFAKKARSAGGILVIAYQSHAGLKDPQMYGPYYTQEVLAQFALRAVCRLECHESAEHTSQLIGDQEVEQVTRSKTTSNQGVSRTVSSHPVIRRVMLPSEIMDFPTVQRRERPDRRLLHPRHRRVQRHARWRRTLQSRTSRTGRNPGFRSAPGRSPVPSAVVI